MERVARRRVAAILCAGSILVACAGDGDESVPASADTSASATGPDDGDLFTEAGSEESPIESGQDATPVVESIPPVPETGVPGIASDDLFCRAWSEYAGSVQALSLAWAVQPAAAASALEVAASDAVARGRRLDGRRAPRRHRGEPRCADR